MNRSGIIGSSIFVLTLWLVGSGGAAAAEWEQIADTGPSGRSAHAAAFDSQRGVLVLFGGNNATDLNDTWEWNGSQWTQVASTGPAIRRNHEMVYDSKRGVTVLFGGNEEQTSTEFGDTWEWDGLTWTLVSEDGPEPRSAFFMAYDIARGVTVLFGGTDGVQQLGDTWEWDGVSWTERVVSGPSSRQTGTMVYDSERGVSVLFGGFEGSQNQGDTWEWDGQTWQEVSNSGPSPRNRHMMTYDCARGVTVLFGGLASGALDDTWEWDGAAWTQASVSGPSPRYHGSLNYDCLRGESVLFGSRDGIVDLGDTWAYREEMPGGPCGACTSSLSLVCGGLSACPRGTFVYSVNGANGAGELLTLTVRALSGPGIPGSPELLSESIAVDSEFLFTKQLRMPETLPNVCPTTFTLEATLEAFGGLVVGESTCSIGFEPLTP